MTVNGTGTNSENPSSGKLRERGRLGSPSPYPGTDPQTTNYAM